MGAAGWGWADVAPYFIRMESWHGGHSDWRGSDGPVHVTRGPRRNPLYHSFVEAGAQAGFELTYDYNGVKQEGFGTMEQTVWRGRRWSAANAYLRPALAGGNVRVVSGLATRVVIAEGRATGVEVARGAAREIVAARREVILSASSINTPKLLMLSGIGPAAHLAEHGLPVVADRPGVGGNLQDHLELYIQMRSLKPVTLYSQYNYPAMARIGLQWLLAKVGPRHLEPVRSRPPSSARPRASSTRTSSITSCRSQSATTAGRRSGGTASRRMSARCARPRAARSGSGAPTPRRRRRSASTTSPTRRIGSISAAASGSPARSSPNRRSGPMPATRSSRAPTCRPTTSSTPSCAKRWRAPTTRAARPASGGATIPLAVVDPECRVIGVDGLRVVDSSIFPRITNGNLNAPSMMVGEKAADHILGRPMLPRFEAEPWINPRWRTSDR